MSCKIIDGNAHAAQLRQDIGRAVQDFTAACGRKPGLAVVLAGEDSASLIYVRNKGKMTVAAGMESFEYRLPESVNQLELLELVDALNKDPRVDGILVQLPIPAHLDEAMIIAAINPAKDVDGFHVMNSGRLAIGSPGLVPCTPLGCLKLLESELDDLSGLEAVIVGRSNIVGKPMAQLLLSRNCTVTMTHSKTRGLASVVRRADIVVAAVGQPEMIRGSWIKDGATVIDVGINRIAVDSAGRTRIVGDVATNEAMRHAQAITPVPGGVGPMTIAMLLRNTLYAAYANEGLNKPAEL